MKNLVQGVFRPKNPKKYVGNVNNIVYRSSWERMIFQWVDNTPAIMEWASEEIVIPYFNPIDNAMHRYFPDLWFRQVYKDQVRECVVEIKPIAHSIRPVFTKGQRRKTQEQMLARYIQNCVKWSAAKHYCISRGWEFYLVCNVEGSASRFSRRDDILEAAIVDGHKLLTEKL